MREAKKRGEGCVWVVAEHPLVRVLLVFRAGPKRKEKKVTRARFLRCLLAKNRRCNCIPITRSLSHASIELLAKPYHFMRIGAALDVYEGFVGQIAMNSFPLSSKNPNQISTVRSHSNKGTRNSGRMCSENRGSGSAIMHIKINDDG